MTVLEATSPVPFADSAEPPQVSMLAGDAVLIVWNVPQPSHHAAHWSVVEGGSITIPSASLRLPRVNGGTRLLWVLRRSTCEALKVSICAKAFGRNVDIAVDSKSSLKKVDPVDILHDISEAGQVAFVSALFNVWGPLLRLQHSIEYVTFLQTIIGYLAPAPLTAMPIARVGPSCVAMRTALAKEFGSIDAIYGLGDRAHRIAAVPYRTSTSEARRDSLYFLLESSLLNSPNALVVFIGLSGVSVRKLDAASAMLPSIARWMSQHGKAEPRLREHLLEEVGKQSDTGRAIALEAQLRAPLQPRRLVGQAMTPAAEIVTALSTSAGSLVTGWYSDPTDLVSGLHALESDVYDLTDAMHRFPVAVKDPRSQGQINATGFAALSPHRGTVTILQPRFRLDLKSGSRHTLVPPTQPATPVEARALALRAVPPEHVSETLLASTLAPVIADLHSRAIASVGRPTKHQIGTPVSRPKVSVIIPLYKVLDFIRFQVAAFASDPWFRANAELIIVLDSPEQAADVQHLLGGLFLIHSLPTLLIVMERNAGYARASNEGAWAARSDMLAMVNSDVIPVGAGWLDRLCARLGGSRRVGAVGPKLMFEDGSIQHAGMFFAKDHRGRWLNHHFHKGMPRSYRPAMDARVVPAVTGACVVTRRSTFEEVGGFTEDYVIGDYEDSDLCLKMTAAGRRIFYEPQVELYHLERKSMSTNAEYMRGVAWQYNCALHSQRWGDLIAEISEAGKRRSKDRGTLA